MENKGKIIISVHTPKAAGTSLVRLFQQAFGEQSVLCDYTDLPADPGAAMYLDPDGWNDRRPEYLPESIRVVHGHFVPDKYDLIPNAYRLTFLRHPVDNIVSIFFYWQKYCPSPTTALYDYFRSRQLTVIELARLPLLRYLYTRTYFGSFDMNRFDFVGCHEHREEDLRLLSDYLGLSLDASVRLNTTDETEPNAARTELMQDRRMMLKLRDILHDDMLFYERYALRSRCS